MKRSLWLVLGLLLVVPSHAHAGLLDIIWQMSGPQLIGIGIQCEVALRSGNPSECIVFPGFRLPRPDLKEPDRAGAGLYWLIVEARAYASTGKNASEGADPVNFRVGRVRMIGVDAMVARRWSPIGSRTRAYSAAGVSLNHLFGADIEQIDNYAYKLRPIGVDRRFGPLTIGAAFNMRIYPNGFEALPGGGLRLKDGSELVHGFLIEVRF